MACLLRILRIIRWKGFFEKIKFNHGTPYVASDITEMFVQPSIACNSEPPIEQEIIFVIKKFKANKTRGEDGLRIEIFKYYPLPFTAHFQQWHGRKK